MTCWNKVECLQANSVDNRGKYWTSWETKVCVIQNYISTPTKRLSISEKPENQVNDGETEDRSKDLLKDLIRKNNCFLFISCRIQFSPKLIEY